MKIVKKVVLTTNNYFEKYMTHKMKYKWRGKDYEKNK